MARMEATPEEVEDIGPDDLTPQQRVGPDGDPGHPGDLTPEEERVIMEDTIDEQAD